MLVIYMLLLMVVHIRYDGIHADDDAMMKQKTRHCLSLDRRLQIYLRIRVQQQKDRPVVDNERRTMSGAINRAVNIGTF